MISFKDRFYCCCLFDLLLFVFLFAISFIRFIFCFCFVWFCFISFRFVLFYCLFFFVSFRFIFVLFCFVFFFCRRRVGGIAWAPSSRSPKISSSFLFGFLCASVYSLRPQNGLHHQYASLSSTQTTLMPVPHRIASDLGTRLHASTNYDLY